MEDERIIEALYEGILRRPADAGGREMYVAALRNGRPLATIIGDILASNEFKGKSAGGALPTITLPDLTKVLPDKYLRADPAAAIFKAASDADFDLLESLILRHRYYDSGGVWTPTIDLDKRVTAALAVGLGATNCLELGCFSGSVLSVLQTRGVEVCGVELSHLAFVLAHENVHDRIRYGDLLELKFTDQFDVILAMDILEHLNPNRLDRYVVKLASLLRKRGFALVNSPMFGEDTVFGSPFPSYLPEWRDEGDEVFWHTLHCDAKGWPMHGHLVWASPRWWEAMFARNGLVRDYRIEASIHRHLAGFFEKHAPARRSFFVLRTADFLPAYDEVTAALAANISLALNQAA